MAVGCDGERGAGGGFRWRDRRRRRDEQQVWAHKIGASKAGLQREAGDMEVDLPEP